MANKDTNTKTTAPEVTPKVLGSFRNFSKREFLKLHRDMEQYHGVFGQLWTLGRPVFDNSIPTACVGFDKQGECMLFRFNPDFWDSCSEEKKKFVVAHECLHVIYAHGKRMRQLNKQKGNKAADVVINHGLVDQFGFDRDVVDPEVEYPEEVVQAHSQLKGKKSRQYCWVETVYKNPAKVPTNKSMEFYYKLLEDGEGKGGGGQGQGGEGGESDPNGQLVDGHDYLDGFTEEDLKDISEAIQETLSEEELESLKSRMEAMENEGDDPEDKSQNGNMAGSIAGNMFKQLNVKKVKKKKKWETVIKRWSLKYIKPERKDIEQWAVMNRRFSMLPTNMFLPTEMEVDDNVTDEKKIKVWFFQDTSGSCSHLVDRFFKAAMSLPEDRFDVKMHCFDTKVYETNLKSQKLYGFGGTTFSCIERYIQSVKHKEGGYPEAVFVITDGYGDHVQPEKPEKWYWFIDGDPYLIPAKSHKFELKNFE